MSFSSRFGVFNHLLLMQGDFFQTNFKMNIKKSDLLGVLLKVWSKIH